MKEAARSVTLISPLLLFLTTTSSSTEIPNDLQDTQWNIDNVGQDGGKHDADIDGPEAWMIETGVANSFGPSPVVAVIDSGVDLDHPELRDKLWINPGEIPGNGLDDDHNGCIDDINGCRFTSDPGSAGTGDVNDTFGHGTGVAGIIAAKTDNGSGIAGICWGCRIMILKTDFTPLGTSRSIIYAYENGADVINLSLGSETKTSSEEEAVSMAIDQGVIVVASKGNDGQAVSHYPADLPGVIAVGASDRLDRRLPTSNILNVDLLAPGEDIPTTLLGGGIGLASETSYSTPEVAAVAALLRHRRSGASVDDIAEVLRISADSEIEPNVAFTPPTLAPYVGSGRLNAFKALSSAVFTDVALNAWYLKYVMYAFQEGVVEGVPASPGMLYLPADSTSRAEVLKMAFLSAGVEPTYPEGECSGSLSFIDVPLDSWFCSYAADGKSAGYVEGKNQCVDAQGQTTCQAAGGLNCFCPNEDVIRAEAAKIVYAVSNDIDFRGRSGECSGTGPFIDIATQDWFCEPVEWLASSILHFPEQYDYLRKLPNDIEFPSPLIEGFPDGEFKPYQKVNRAEMAKIVATTMLYCRTGPDPANCRVTPGASTSRAGSLRTTTSSIAIGRVFEQVIDPANQHAPTPVTLPGGSQQIVTGDFVFPPGETHDADGDELFYFWRANGGSFTTADPVNFSSVTWHPPQVTEDTVFRINVLRGDGRGKVGRASFDFTVLADSGGSPASGTITSPNGTQSGTVTASATASDADGLQRVSVSFVNGGSELDLCGGGAAACAGTSGTYSQGNIDPSVFGATAGPVTLRLFVEDSTGDRQEVDQHTFTYEPPDQGTGFTLTVMKQGDGDGTVSGGGISCPPGCSSASTIVPEGDIVTLSGSPDASSTWVGFAGDRCYGPADCTFTMISDYTIRASFGVPDQLAIAYSSPADGDTNAAPSTQPSVYFNRQVNLGPTVGDIVFREVGGADVSFNPVLSTAASDPRRRLYLVTSGSLSRGTSYEVMIPAGAVVDDNGNLLPLPFSFGFTVAENNISDMYLTAYPIKIMEGSETTVDVWFTQPADYDRTITLSATDPGILKPEDLGAFLLPAGETLLHTAVDTEYSPGSTTSAFTTLQATEASAGTLSRTLEVANYTSVTGTTLRFLAAGVYDDEDGDGVFEANERAELLVEVWNSGSNYVINAELAFRVLNTTEISILGGRPHTCFLGTLYPGQVISCSKTLLADEQIATGDYYIEVDGRSVSGGFLDQARLTIVNNALPDYTLDVGPLTSYPQQPGSVLTLKYTSWNRGDGFNLTLPQFEVFMEVEGVEQLLYRTYADARGEIFSSQTLELPIIAPATPGSYPIRGRINPGPSPLPESNPSNNEALERILNVAEPNLAPVLDPISEPLSAHVGEELTFLATATDPNGDTLAFRLGPGAPPGATIGGSSGIFSWTPPCGADSVYQIEVIVEDQDLASDSQVVSIEVGLSADLRIEKTVSTPLALPGEQVSFTLTVVNDGPSCIANATVQDTFTASFEEVTWTCSGTGGGHCQAAGNGDILDSGVELSAGASVTYDILGTIVSGAIDLAENTASVLVPPGAIDPNGTNNQDYVSLTIRDLDYGDAPDGTLAASWNYSTRLNDDGARHAADTVLVLGAAIDGEADGQPDQAALGDDASGSADEDGVHFVSSLVLCEEATLEVTVSTAGFLDAWLDFNSDGDWSEAGEQIFASEALVAGVNSLTFTVPCSSMPTARTFTRFRLSSVGGLTPTGLAADGEVEDYAVSISQIFYTLNVTPAGNGGGIVLSTPAGIDCGTDCVSAYPAHTPVTLTATPAIGSDFVGWSNGPCTGNGQCAFNLEGDTTITATFEVQASSVTVVKNGDGDCTVSSSPVGINCGSDCSEQFPFGTLVTLTATAAQGSIFSGWSGGGCAGTALCEVIVAGPITVTATCDLESYDVTVSKDGTGAGTVLSSPPGIDCGVDCAEAFPSGSVVTLTAMPEAGSQFEGWSEPSCPGVGDCVITVDDAIALTATFSLDGYTLSVSSTGNGTGTVRSSPPGIDCGVDCEEPFPPGTTVTLTPYAGASSAFVAWSGACSGPGECQVTLLGDASVVAQFDRSCVDDMERSSANWVTGSGPEDGGNSQSWQIVTTDSYSPTQAWFCSDEDHVKDQVLMTALSTPLDEEPALLRFRHRLNAAYGSAGGVLEFSLDSGLTWFDIVNGDRGSIPFDPSRITLNAYNGVLTTCCSNPLAGRAAWTGDSGGWEEVVVDLSDFLGHQVHFRWRFVSDDTAGFTGWWIDDVVISGTTACPLGAIFSDGFETGDTSRWSAQVP